jgi:RHS repeat-associated protein
MEYRSDSPPLLPLQAQHGVTAVAGDVRTLNNEPLEGVTLRIASQTTRTDRTGRFLLTSLSPGHHVLLIDGRTASRAEQTYGVFEIGVNAKRGRTNVLPFTIWMPEIDMANALSIPSPTADEVVVSNPNIPGLELHLPPGTIIRDKDGQVVTQVSITPIPVDRPPFPLPFGAEFPMYFTVQPGGAYIEPYGARIIYPNVTDEPPGTRINFWNYDFQQGGWYIYGKGTVTEDRKQVVPDEGVAIYELRGASIGPFDPAPAFGDKDDDGDPVDLGTGLFVLKKTDLILPDVLPITLTRTHRRGGVLQGARPFGIGSNHPYELFLLPDTQDNEVDLILPDGARVHYTRISPAGVEDNVVFEHSTTPSAFFRSRLHRIKRSFWELRLNDGMVYVFERVLPPQLTLIRDRYGNTIHIIRREEEHGKVSKIISPNGRWLEFTIDEEHIEHNVVQVRDNFGRIISYSYDDRGRLSTVTDPLGGVTEYTYEFNQIRTIKDARGIVFLTNEYDEKGRVIKQTQADGSTYQFEYTVDDAGKIIQTVVVDPRGNIRRVTFNGDGYMLTDTRAVGTPEEQTTTYERQPGTNLILSTTDALGRKTAYTHDAMGNITSIIQLAETPQAVTTQFTYEPKFNQVTRLTDPLGHATVFTYDERGTLTSVTDQTGSSTILTYNLAGQPVSITDSLQNATQFRYDSGNLVAVTDPLGSTIARFTDSAGRLVSLANALGHTTRYTYDALNRLTQVTDALGDVTTFDYDPNGNLLSMTDARGNATSYAYDNMDRLASRTDPLGRFESYKYDAAGNLTQFTDRKGQVTSFDYDGLNRRIQATYNDASAIRYIYDTGDRLTQVADSTSGIITATYDGLDGVTSETTPQGSVSHNYDAAGRRTSMTVAGQPSVAYTYDDADHLTQLTQEAAVVAFTYDRAGKRLILTLPNGITAAYAYDATSRISGIIYTAGETTLGNLGYAYDAAGRRTEVGGSWARVNLPSAMAGATYDDANQLLTFGSETLTYDVNGNLISEGNASYTWNARNQLVSTARSSFSYDGLGRRVQKTVDGVKTEFLYDGINLVQELSNGVPTKLLTCKCIDEYFARADLGRTEFFLTDALGSTVALTDVMHTVQTEYTYEPFGKTTATGAISANPLQYTGRENDQIGLYYYRARYYHPTLQRFVSEDSLDISEILLLRQIDPDDEYLRHLHATMLSDVQLMHPTLYVTNDPINYRDPTGELPVPASVAIGCAVGAGVSIGFDILAGRKISWTGAAVGCAMGAIGGLSGPKGPLFGRGRYRGGDPGIFNRGNFRVGWSWYAARGRNMFGFHGGVPGSPGHWHFTPIPGPRGPLW